MGTNFTRGSTIRMYLILTLFSDSFLEEAKDYLLANRVRRSSHNGNGAGTRAFNDDLKFLQGSPTEGQLVFEDKLLGFRELIDSMKGLKYSEESINEIIRKDGNWNEITVREMIRSTPYYNINFANHSYDADSLWSVFGNNIKGDVTQKASTESELSVINDERKALGLPALVITDNISDVEPIKNIIAPNPITKDVESTVISNADEPIKRTFNFLETLAIIGSVQRKLMMKTDLMESLGYNVE